VLSFPYISEVTAFILKGGIFSLELYAVTILLAVPLGVIMALIKISKYRALRYSVGMYTWIFRGTPLLLQLMFFYYGLSVVGIGLQPFTAAVLTFVLNYGAYFTEIYRAGIESVDKGQYEASRALSMTYGQTMRRIIIPQVIRRSIPPTCNEAISLIKDTALVGVIGISEILQSARAIQTRDLNLIPYVIAGVIYLLFTMVVVYAFKRVEDRYKVYE
jgi:polar amino acid transport system permease protein